MGRYGLVSGVCISLGGSLFVCAMGILWLYPGAAFCGCSVCLYSGKFILAKYSQNTPRPNYFLHQAVVSPLEVLSPGYWFQRLGAGIYIGTFDLSIQLDAYGTCFIIGIITNMRAFITASKGILTASTRC